MQAEQGAAIAAIAGHLLLLGLLLALNHLHFQEQKLAAAPIYVHLGQYFQQPAEAAPAPLPPEKRPEPKPKTIDALRIKKMHPVQDAPEHPPAPVSKTKEKLARPTQQYQPPTPTSTEVHQIQSQTNQTTQTSEILVQTHEPQPIATKSSSAPALAPAPDSDPDQSGAYLAENYARIRDLIADNIVFPPIARKLGWKGRLTVSFTLDLTGNASAIHIVESSGKELLDRNVVAAIRKTTPFPSPKHTITLVLPVTYNLR